MKIMTKRLLLVVCLLSAVTSGYAWQLVPGRTHPTAASAHPYLKPAATQLQVGKQSQLLEFVDAIIGNKKKDKEDHFSSVEDFDEDLALEIQEALQSAGIDGIGTAESSPNNNTTTESEGSNYTTNTNMQQTSNMITEKKGTRLPMQSKAVEAETPPPHTSLAQVMANQMNIDLSSVTPSKPGGKITASDVEYHAWVISQPPSTPEALTRAYHLGLDLNMLYDDEDRTYVMQLSDVQLYEENARSLGVCSQKRKDISPDDSSTRQRMKKLSALDNRMEKSIEVLAKKAKQLTSNVADGISKKVKQTSDLQVVLRNIDKTSASQIISVQDFDADLANEIQEALMSVESNNHEIKGNQSEPVKQTQEINESDTNASADINEGDEFATETTNILSMDYADADVDDELESMQEITRDLSIYDVDTDADDVLATIQTSMTVNEIKGKLRRHGVSLSGNKSDLVKRLSDVNRLQCMKIPELKQELRERGLKVSGVKAELVKRLLDVQKENEEADIDFDINNERKEATDNGLFFIDMK
ncbi:hypothetical protein ACHAWC_001808 [Mediolabrus comicus]